MIAVVADGMQEARSMAAHVLAIDCGSTNLKAAVFDGDLTRLAEVAVPTPYSRFTGTTVEMDPDAVWDSARRLIKDAVAAAAGTDTEVATITFSSQAQTFAMLGPDGAARTPFYSWLDARAEAESATLAARVGDCFHRHSSFPRPTPQIQLAKLLWLQRHRPAVVAGGVATSLPGYLARQLTGRDGIDRNLAAMHGMYSLETGSWWGAALTAINLSADALPPLLDVGGSLMAARRPGCDLPLARHLRIVFGGNDQTAGAYGNGCRPGRVVCTLGTALVAYRCAGETPGPYAPTTCWGPFPGGGYYEMAVCDQGCLALDRAREMLFPGGAIADFDAAAAAACATGGSAGVHFYPERSAGADAWRGTGSPAQRALAVLEGISFSLRRLVLEELGGGDVTALEVIGGGSRSDLWLQLVADTLGLPVHRGRGDSLLGVARLAVGGAAAGAAPERTWTPRLAPCRSAAAYDGWRQHA